MAHEWNEHYLRGELPWDTDEPDPHLMELVRSGIVTRGRALEIGSGTGTNALWLAGEGFDVVGVDIAERAIEMARAKAGSTPRVHFVHADFLADDAVEGPFDFVFDRGTFHVFDDAEAQARFAARVASVLRPEGLWLSVIGSTEGPPRQEGPPRRSALDIVTAIEPVLEIVSLRGTVFHADDRRPRAWACLSRRRTTPAQPSTRRP
ncbi:MAG TPA: class I SAM-dependent methyltransferase [Vicinamibacterales bacterium]